jgi:hypothetical protein
MIYWILVSAVCFIIMALLVATAPEYVEKEDGSMVPKQPKTKKRTHTKRFINEDFIHSPNSAAFLSTKKIKLPYFFSFLKIIF